MSTTNVRQLCEHFNKNSFFFIDLHCDVTRTLNEQLQEIRGSFAKKKKIVCQLNFSIRNWILIRSLFLIVSLHS